MDIIARSERKYDVPLNVAIWMSFKPIIKVYLSIGTGFILSKRKILTPELQKGISRLVMLVLLPCLIFNNLVSQIKDTDIKLLGVIVFSGFIFYTVGFLWGLVIRMITPIPRAWFGGLLLCCMINNSSDLPLAYVQAVGGSPLFPSGMAERGISYCVLFLIVFILFSFNLGGTRLIAWDAHRNVNDPRKNEPTVPPLSWSGVKKICKHMRLHFKEMLHGDFSSLKSKKHDKQQPEEDLAPSYVTAKSSESDEYINKIESAPPIPPSADGANNTQNVHGANDPLDPYGPSNANQSQAQPGESRLSLPGPSNNMRSSSPSDMSHESTRDYRDEEAMHGTPADPAGAHLQRSMTDNSEIRFPGPQNDHHRWVNHPDDGSHSLKRSTSRKSAFSMLSRRSKAGSDTSIPSLTPDERRRLSLSRFSTHSNPADFRNVDTAANAQRHLEEMKAIELEKEKENNDNDNEDKKSSKSTQSVQKPPTALQKRWARFKVKWFRFKSKNLVTTYLCNAIEDIFLPQMLSLIAGIIVCMIPWVRRVFVTGQNIKGFRDAPDGAPPLDFFMQFLSFFSAAQVPLGLMLLGATIAQLQLKALVPGFWKTLILIVVFKLCLLPIIACGWITRMRKIGWLDMDDTMTPIVLAIVSGTPSATIQIYLTIAFMDNPNEESVEMNCLAVALLAQYALLPITLTFVGTFTIMHFV